MSHTRLASVLSIALALVLALQPLAAAASIADGENAVNVLGQADFTGSNSADTQAGLSSPGGLAYDAAGQRLFVAEQGGNRVKVFDVAPVESVGGGGGGGGGGSSRHSRGGGGSSRHADTADRTGITDRASGATSTPATPALAARDLVLGAEGPDVRALQRLLNAAGFAVAASGPGAPGAETEYFGERTRAAVARLQAAAGVAPAAGYFGPLTRAWVAANRPALVFWE
jgi:hypothetical protein